MPLYGQLGQAVAVCEQREWDREERLRPGRVLVRDGIASEAEADALARQGSGYKPPAELPRKAARRLKMVQDWPTGRADGRPA